MKASSFTCSFLQALGVVSAFLFSSTGFAQPATFKEGILQILQTAALIKHETHYYNDIQLALDTNGNFTVLEAEPSPLVFVDSVTVIMTKSLPPQVSIVVRGNKSVPCVELQIPLYSGMAFRSLSRLRKPRWVPLKLALR